MLIRQLINEKFLKLLFAGFVSYYFGLIILQYNFKAAAVLGVVIFLFIFLTRIEYAFYFILASRSIVEILFSVEAVEGTRMTHLIGVLLVFFFIYYVIVISRFNIFSLDINKIYGTFLLLSIPSIFFTKSLTTGLGFWFRFFQGFLIFNITILIILKAGSEAYKKKINIICWAVVIALFVPLFLFLKNYIQGTYVVGTGDIIRYSKFAAHYNVFPYLSFFIFSYCLFLYSITIRNSKKILWLIFLVTIIFVIGTSYTRNIWIGLAVLLLTWNLLRKNFMITASCMGIIILIIIFSPVVRDRLKDIYIVLTSKSFFELDPLLGSGRIGIWQANINYFIDHSTLIEKLIGNGFDISYKVAEIFHRKAIGTHNNYITLLMTTGIFGLTAYLLYIIKLFQEAFKLLRRTKEIYFRNLSKVFISLLLAYVIISMQTHILWFISIQYYFSVFAGFVIAANIIEERNKMEIKS